MKNGNAFRTFTDEAQQYLSGLKVVIYYAEPLPSSTDERLRLIVDRFLRGTAVEQEQFQLTLAQEHRSLFGIFGHRAATLAVRQNSQAWLLAGIVGAVIANYVISPKRNVDVSLAVYHHCARKIGYAPAELFAEAARFAQPALAEKLHSFGHRANINLKQFGWHEQKTPEGVRYKFSW
ncbi:hypothetical protein [Candidatus Leptofilum sp.]|uniref:hypothetical protein n=1 Tax=Candidatus Leptofilum sp. TaxID=3241576 RepID=UPI003B58BB58